MPHPRSVRRPWRAAGLAVAALVIGLPAAGAVLPLSDDGLPGIAAGPRADLLTQSLSDLLAGHWRGQTPCGSTITLDLHTEGRALAGEAHFGADMAASNAVRLTPLMVGQRTVLLSIPAHAGGRASFGVLTFVSGASVRLELQGGSSPLSVTLSRIG